MQEVLEAGVEQAHCPGSREHIFIGECPVLIHTGCGGMTFAIM